MILRVQANLWSLNLDGSRIRATSSNDAAARSDPSNETRWSDFHSYCSRFIGRSLGASLHNGVEFGLTVL
jgi:hypothetical protein